MNTNIEIVMRKTFKIPKLKSLKIDDNQVNNILHTQHSKSINIKISLH